MTIRQFNAAVKRAGLTPMMSARARRVLVDGERPSDVAKSEGVKSGTVYATLSKMTLRPDANERIWPTFAPPPPKKR